jgi:hypothetical protein
MSRLSDLDEATLRCYNNNSAEYLREAIACYQSGAFRSAIVTTWNCVFFDLMEKIRELSLSGDAAATTYFEKFESAIERGDVSQLLAIERKILDDARTRFEFFGNIEYVDLNRIHEDRNRCAHPTVNSSGEIFHPSADLARSHIVHAIDHLLSFPPTHGKNALLRLLDDIKSPYFPTSVPRALEVLEKSPLVRARRSLARNFVITLCKTVARESDYRLVSRAKAALRAYSKINHKIYTEILSNEVSTIIRSLVDAELSGAVRILATDNLSWEYLEADQRLRLEGFFENLKGSDLDFIEQTFEIKELEVAASKCANRVSIKDIRQNVWFVVPRLIIDRLVLLYYTAWSFDQANVVAKTIIECISDLSEDDAVKIIQNGIVNDQVKGSFEFPNLVRNLSVRFPDCAALSDLLAANGLTPQA